MATVSYPMCNRAVFQIFLGITFFCRQTANVTKIGHKQNSEVYKTGLHATRIHFPTYKPLSNLHYRSEAGIQLNKSMAARKGEFGGRLSKIEETE